MLRLLALIPALLTLAACGSSGSANPAPAGLSVSGRVTFDRVPVVAGHGLDYAATVAQR